MKQMFRGRGFLARDQDCCAIGRYRLLSPEENPPSQLRSSMFGRISPPSRDSNERHDQTLAPIAKKDEQVARANGAVPVDVRVTVLAVIARSPRSEQDQQI